MSNTKIAKRKLQVYCEEGDTPGMYEILETCPELLNQPNDTGNPPLSIAIRHSQQHAIQGLFVNYPENLEVNLKNHVILY